MSLSSSSVAGAGCSNCVVVITRMPISWENLSLVFSGMQVKTGKENLPRRSTVRMMMRTRIVSRISGKISTSLRIVL